MNLQDEIKFRRIMAGGVGVGSGRHAGAAAYAQTDIAKVATHAANKGAKDSETPNKPLERAAMKAHQKAEQMHQTAAGHYLSEGNPVMSNQHRAAAEEHGSFVGYHQNSL